jgi:hypothetical protein
MVFQIAVNKLHPQVQYNIRSVIKQSINTLEHTVKFSLKMAP